MLNETSKSESIDHRLGDERHTAFGSAEACGVLLGIFADDEIIGNANAAIDDRAR